MEKFLWVGAGGGLGAMMRFGMYRLVPNQPAFYVTMAINIIGSFILGLLLGWFVANDNVADSTKLFLATGLCGGFTTFSTFSTENMILIQEGKYGTAAFCAIGSVVFGLLASFLGYKLMQ